MTPYSWATSALVSAVMVFVTHRYGMPGIWVALIFMRFYVFFPFTTSLTAWYATGFTLNLIILLSV